MTAHVALDGFIELASALPMPTARLALPATATRKIDAEWNAARKAYEKQIALWRSAMLRHLAMMRAELEQARAEVGAETVGAVVTEQIPKLRDVVAEVLAVTAARRDDHAAQAKTKIDLAGGLSAEARKLGNKFLKQYRAAISQQIEYLVDADNRLYALELDFDPEAHTPNGPPVTTAAELESYLASLKN